MTSHENILNKIPLSRRRMVDLVNTAVLPVVAKLDQKVANQCEKTSIEAFYIRFMVEFAIATVYMPNKQRDIVKKFKQQCHQEGSCFIALNELWPEYVERLWAWVEHSELVPEAERDSLEQRVRNIPGIQALLQQMEEDAPVIEEDHDGFLVEASVAGSEEINQLHTSDEETEVISAKAFLVDAGIDSERIEDLRDDIEGLNHLFDQHLVINDVFVESFAQGLGRLAATLYGSYEFQALGSTLEQLIHMMRTMALKLTEEQKSMLLLLLEQLVHDLSSWFEHVFQLQDAVDIHYLDAALLAALAQIELMFDTEQPAAGSEENPEEDDFVMF